MVFKIIVYNVSFCRDNMLQSDNIRRREKVKFLFDSLRRKKDMIQFRNRRFDKEYHLAWVVDN